MSPLPQIPAQGDSARLEQVASGLKQTGGTHGPTVQRTPAGRPPGTGGTPAPRATQQQFEVPPEHQSLMQQAAEAEATRQFWVNWAKQYPGPNSDFYLNQAEALAEQAHEALYTATPNLEP